MGFIGEVHARAVARSGGTLVAVADSTAEKAEAAAQRLGIPQAFSSPEELILSRDVDVVHICTPNHLHEGLAEMALKADKHVICEKPLAVDCSGAARLVELAEATALVAAVPFIYRFYPMVREIRERLRSGEAGRVHLLHGSYLQDWLAHASHTNWRVDPARGGASRAFGDIGIHWCDLIEFATGHRITELVASTAAPYGARDLADSASKEGAAVTEDLATVVFRTDGGASGSVVVSQTALGRKNRLWLEIDGEDAAFSFDQEQPDSLWIGGQDITRILPRGSADTSPTAGVYNKLPQGHPQGYQDCFDAFVSDVYAAIAGGKPDGLPTFQDGLRSARITSAVMKSSRERRWVAVDA
jgi:predicted dehydrogenase